MRIPLAGPIPKRPSFVSLLDLPMEHVTRPFESNQLPMERRRERPSRGLSRVRALVFANINSDFQDFKMIRREEWSQVLEKDERTFFVVHICIIFFGYVIRTADIIFWWNINRKVIFPGGAKKTPHARPTPWRPVGDPTARQYRTRPDNYSSGTIISNWTETKYSSVYSYLLLCMEYSSLSGINLFVLSSVVRIFYSIKWHAL